MKRILLVLGIASFISVACSNEPLDSSVVGSWKLTEVNINLPNGFDINNDGVRNTNLLDEIDCANKEVLTFEPNGVMQSNLTFNPDVDIFLLDEATQNYAFNVKCDLEGAIGYATSYIQEGEIIKYNNRSAFLVGNQLYMIFKSAIAIYNSDGSEIVDIEDLTLVYTKQ